MVLLLIADIYKKRPSDATFKSEMVLGIILMQSRSLLVSMFQSFMLSLEAANRNSAFSSKVRLVIADESKGVMFIPVNSSKSQYFTVLSVDPFAKA